MRKITPSEKKVIERLIFAEGFDVLQIETGLSYGELRDDLINLINAGLIYAFESDTQDSDTSPFIDVDNLKDFSFRATKSGLRAINQTS